MGIGLGWDWTSKSWRQELDFLLARLVCTRQTDWRETRRTSRRPGGGFIKTWDRDRWGRTGIGDRTGLPDRVRRQDRVTWLGGGPGSVAQCRVTWRLGSLGDTTA
jgi:hypothetical protein